VVMLVLYSINYLLPGGGHQGPMVVLGGKALFLMSEVPRYQVAARTERSTLIITYA